MGPKILALALVLLLPNAVSADAEGGSESEIEEPCNAVEVFSNPPGAAVNPECVDNLYAEESK